MTQPVASLIESLVSAPGLGVREAGEKMLRVLSGGAVTPEAFRDDPRILVGPDHRASRYLAQVTWRALGDDYESVDEVIAGLYGVLDRNPPTIEAKSSHSEDLNGRVLIPEAKVLRIRHPVAAESGQWEAVLEAQVTSGPMRDHEIEIRTRSAVNPTACFIVPYFWVHATFAAYNLIQTSDRGFEDCPETFFVLEPLRQVNATSVARSLNCPKPQIDQIRRGRGDVTIHTLKGMLVHGIFDRILEGEDDIESCYDAVLPGFLVQMATVTDDLVDEAAFRTEVLRHAKAIKDFVDINPHMREDPQLELRRYSATLGIQGRIDAVFQSGNRLDVVELKTGKRLYLTDHAQLFIYRLLLSDMIRRAHNLGDEKLDLTTRLMSSHDGTTTPLRIEADFYQVMEARNRLVAMSYALARSQSHLKMRYPGFDSAVCDACLRWTRADCEESTALFGDRSDAEDGPALEYFRKFSRLIQQEKWTADQDLADLLDDSRIGYRVRNFRTISGAHCRSEESGEFIFDFEDNRSDLGRGDRVLIHSGRISSSAIFHGYIRSIENQHARIFIPLKNLSEETFKEGSWTIDRFPSDQTSVAGQTALYDFLRSPMDEKKRVILGDVVAAGTSSESTPPSRTMATGGDLNTSQIQAVERASGCQTFHLIWGPPGTGKTKVIPRIVAESGGSVLLGAFTNTAVDKMLLALLDYDPAARFVRVGRASASPELASRLGARASEYFTDDLAASTKSPGDLRLLLDEIPIVAATSHRASSHPYVRGRSFDMAVVDEASQLTEPLTLGLVMRARRFVLIGDDRQLPPVVRTIGLGYSMFERLKNVVESEAPELLTLLDIQYRMHPDIMGVSNRLYYEGLLTSGVSRDDRRPVSGSPIEFHPVESTSDGRSNLAEARVVQGLVGGLSGDTSPESIGVISPFRAQVVLLRRFLEGTGVAVDTVERFQGGEREVIILSFVRSHGTGFVFDDRRFNVAITRARSKLVMVAHPDLFRNTRYAWICEFSETPKTSTTT
jgi:DNA replication ATP-dependent helicase Dna2